MVSDLIREREPNMELDGGKMPVFAFSGSGASENDQSSDLWGEHKTTKEYKAIDQTQKISSAMDDEFKPQSVTIEQVEEDIEHPVSRFI